MKLDINKLLDDMIVLKKKGLSYDKIIQELDKRIIDTLGKDYNFDTSKNILNSHDVRNAINGEKELALSRIQKRLRKFRVEIEEDLDKLSKDNPDKPKYEVSETDYIFRKNGKIYTVSMKKVDEIFNYFSKYGKGFNCEETRKHFKLSNVVWNLIKNRLSLYKTSNIISDETLSRLDENEVESYIEDNISENIEDKYTRIFEKKDKRVREKLLKDLWYKVRNQEKFLDDVIEPMLDNIIPLNPSDVETVKLDNNEYTDFFFSDTHLGNLNTDDTIKRIIDMGDEIANHPAKNIMITFNGDLAECLLPRSKEMHSGQREGMIDMESEDLYLLGFQTLQKLFLKVMKAGKNLKVNLLPGNHGRLTEKNEEDKLRTGERIIYKFLQHWGKNVNLEVNMLKDKKNVITTNNVKYLVLHGDGYTKKELERDILNEKDDKELIIVQGDKHHGEIICLGKGITHVIIPGLGGRGQYDKDMGFNSDTGYFVVEHKSNNKTSKTIEQI